MRRWGAACWRPFVPPLLRLVCVVGALPREGTAPSSAAWCSLPTFWEPFLTNKTPTPSGVLCAWAPGLHVGEGSRSSLASPAHRSLAAVGRALGVAPLRPKGQPQALRRVLCFQGSSDLRVLSGATPAGGEACPSHPTLTVQALPPHTRQRTLCGHRGRGRCHRSTGGPHTTGLGPRAEGRVDPGTAKKPPSAEAGVG